MDEFRFDIKALISAIMLQTIAASGDKQSRQTIAVLKVFQNHNIDALEATEILMEIAASIGGTEAE